MDKYFSDKVDVTFNFKSMSEIYDLAAQMEREGREVIHMEIGRPDFDTPQTIKDAAMKALDEGNVHYTEFSGIFELRKAIAEREKIKNGLDYNPLDEVIVTVGASEGLYCIWTTFLNPGDEVIMPSPYYSSYPHQLTYVGAKLIGLPIIREGRVKFSFEDFKAKITARTKIILLNSPNNPTGYTMSKKDLQLVANLAIEEDLLVVSDECYDSFVYEGEYQSIASLPGMAERTIVVNSASKTFSMTGWRIGYVLARSHLAKEISKAHNHITACANSFAQMGAIEAYKNVYKEVDHMIGEFKKRRDYVVDSLSKIDKISFIEPQGSFYVFMNIRELGMDDFEFCRTILREKALALAPGSAYGLEWSDYVRLSYTCSMEELRRAMGIIESFANSSS